MKETFRLLPLSRVLRFALSCATLLCSTTGFAADYSNVPAHSRLKTSANNTRPTSSAAVALFEHNDPARAARLAKRESAHFPRQINSWFLAMEAAYVRNDEESELKSALSVCRLSKNDDPRGTVAAMRLADLGENTEVFQAHRAAIESLAYSSSACANDAKDALYRASLDGLANTDVRELAQRAGWLTNWTVTRSGAAANQPAEQFEFVDAQLQLPDYLPHTASYVGKATFLASQAGDYVITGNVAGTNITIDNDEPGSGPVSLAPGPHVVRISFRAAGAPLRIRIVPSTGRSIQDWKTPGLSSREAVYLSAAVSLAVGNKGEAAEQIRSSDIAATAIGQRLVFEASRPGPGNATQGHACEFAQTELLRDCAPDSLAYARWLADTNRHADAIQELSHMVREWPLDRDAHRMLIAEWQRVGNSAAADRAAAAFLSIAPNARNFRRMAQSASLAPDPAAVPFYQSYRRPAPPAISGNAGSPAVILLQDKVAITRLDGSVSLYMHRVVQLMTATGAQEFHALALPEGGQLLTARLVNGDHHLPLVVEAGDEIEEEYVVNYTGDGGMIAHPEAFQYVFNDFDFPLLNARFVVLSPAIQSPGYVIASGDAPASSMDYADGLRVQIWEQQTESASSAGSDPAIIRVVEEENGWSVPPSVERRRILETIHPAPWPHEA